MQHIVTPHIPGEPKPPMLNVLQRLWFFGDLGSADALQERCSLPLASLAVGNGNALQHLKSGLFIIHSN